MALLERGLRVRGDLLVLVLGEKGWHCLNCGTACVEPASVSCAAEKRRPINIGWVLTRE